MPTITHNKRIYGYVTGKDGYAVYRTMDRKERKTIIIHNDITKEVGDLQEYWFNIDKLKQLFV